MSVIDGVLARQVLDSRGRPTVEAEVRLSGGALAERAVSLLPALALARVDGSSPVEYLDESEREIVRRIGRDLLSRPAVTLNELCER